MRLLFDQNISYRLVKHLSALFPFAGHVKQLGLEDAADAEIFDFAKNNDYCIVTFDSDFVDLNVLRGFPPKIIWIRTGNLSTTAVVRLSSDNSDLIQKFLESDEGSILEILR